MLAAFGFLVAERFHPFFGGKIDVPSLIAFQQTPLQKVWPTVLLPIGIIEVLSVFTFESPAGGQLWSIRQDYENGDLGFDPLGLKPSDPYEYRVMQDRELNNGRLAMIGIAGMVAQELATGKKLFMLSVSGTEEATGVVAQVEAQVQEVRSRETGVVGAVAPVPAKFDGLAYAQ